MNLTILGLGLAVMGVSVGEGILVANIAKAAARQPEMFSKLQTLMFTGVAFIEVPSSYCLPLATLSNRQIKDEGGMSSGNYK